MNYGFENPGFTSDWTNADDNTQEYFGLTHHQFLTVRLFQRILNLEKAGLPDENTDIIRSELKKAWAKCDKMEHALKRVIGESHDARAVDLAESAISPP